MTFLEEFSQSLVLAASLHREREAIRSGIQTSTTAISLPFEEDITQLKNKLMSNEIPSLSVYSRRQREIFLAIDKCHTAAKQEQLSKLTTPCPIAANDNEGCGAIAIDSNSVSESEEYANLLPHSFSIFNEFLSKWTEMVPKLATLLAAAKLMEKAENGEAENEMVDEFVEQEGCPEESDFNKWSHHCSVDTCDDDVLMKSMR